VGAGAGGHQPFGEVVWVALVADAVPVLVVKALETIPNRTVPVLASGARGVDVAVGVAVVAPAVTVALVHGVRGLEHVHVHV